MTMVPSRVMAAVIVPFSCSSMGGWYRQRADLVYCLLHLAKARFSAPAFLIFATPPSSA